MAELTQPLTRRLTLPLTLPLNSPLIKGGGVVSPLSLFAGGDGVWLKSSNALLRYSDALMTDLADADADAVGVEIDQHATGAAPLNFFDYANPTSQVTPDGYDFATPYWNLQEVGFFNAPDALGGTVGEGFSITGLDYDGTNFWAGNDGRANGADVTFQPSLVKLSPVDGSKLAEIDLLVPFPSCQSVQGVAVDALDGTLRFVDLTAAKIQHVSLAGADLGDGFVVAGINGLAEDSTRNELWTVSATTLSRYSKAGVLQFSRDIQTGTSPDVDHLHHDPERDWVYITDETNGVPGKVHIYDVQTDTLLGYLVAPQATAIEGIVKIGKVLCITHNGYFHTQALIKKAQVQFYTSYPRARIFGQFAAAKKPSFQTDSGFMSVRGDGGDVLVHNGAFVCAAGAATFVMAIKGAAGDIVDRIYNESRYNTNVGEYAILAGASNAARPGFYLRNDAGTTIINYTGTGTLFDNTWKIFTALDTGSNISFRINGVAAGSSAYTRAGVFSVDQTTLLGSGGLTPAGSLAADIGELLVYPRALTAEQIAIVEASLAAQYGITLP